MLSSEKSLKETARRVFHKARFGVDRFILVQRYKIHYVEAGAGEPLILIPGSYGTYRVWNRLMPLLAREYRLLALDYVGTVAPDKPEGGSGYNIQEETDLIVKMVRQMGLDKVNLIGGQYGGRIVCDFAARYPGLVNKIISLEGNLAQTERIKSAPAEHCLKFPVIGDISFKVVRTRVPPKTGARSDTGKWYSSITPADKEEIPEQTSSRAKKTPRIPRYRISLTRKAPRHNPEQAREIKTPVLYLYGTESDNREILLEENIKYLKSCLPQSWIVALEGKIPELSLQKPAEMADVILGFLHK